MNWTPSINRTSRRYENSDEVSPQPRTTVKATTAKPVAKATSVGESMEMWWERTHIQSTLQGSLFKDMGSSITESS